MPRLTDKEISRRAARIFSGLTPKFPLLPNDSRFLGRQLGADQLYSFIQHVLSPLSLGEITGFAVFFFHFPELLVNVYRTEAMSLRVTFVRCCLSSLPEDTSSSNLRTSSLISIKNLQ